VPEPDARAKSSADRFVNKNYEFYKKMADDRATAKWTKAPKRALTDAGACVHVCACAQIALPCVCVY
jgi:hypothetical protein